MLKTLINTGQYGETTVERRDQGMSWKRTLFSLFQQIETYADVYVILIGMYAVIPIAIATSRSM